MRFGLVALFALFALAVAACRTAPSADVAMGNIHRLPTGQTLDPAGALTSVGQMPLAMIPAPDGRHVVLLLDGYRDEGIQVVDRQGAVTQTITQEAAFIGLAFSRDGRTLFASGGNQDVVYRYRWEADTAALADSIVLAIKQPDHSGTRYPAGLGVSPGGRQLYVAENLADSLEVYDLVSGRLLQRLATGRYPYGVAVAPNGTVYVSNWGASTVSAFRYEPDDHLVAGAWIAACRHPSALLLNPSGTRLFVACGSTDRVDVVDTRAGRVIAELLDPPPGGAKEGATPNALALSEDGTRLFAAEADANAIAVFDLSTTSADVPAALGDDRLAGRIPTGWFPTALLALGDTLMVANGKGAGSSPNPRGPRPGVARVRTGAAAQDQVRQYTLGQLDGSLGIGSLKGASL